MTVKMILAVDRGNSIGWEDGRLPWKISADLKRFKELTTGNDIVMGRKTFESFKLEQGLPNRFNIVISSKLQGYHHDVCVLNDFKNLVLSHQENSPEKDLWIIGGSTIYQQAITLQLVDEIHATLVDVNSDADVKLPFDLYNWKLFILQQAKIGVLWNLEQIDTPYKTDDGIAYTFLTLKKIK